MKGVSKTSLALASSFLGVEADELEDALVSRVMMPKGGSSKGTVIKYVRPSVAAGSDASFCVYSIHTTYTCTKYQCTCTVHVPVHVEPWLCL